MMWWLLLYVCGYAAGVAYAIAVARRAYADRRSMLWVYGEDRIDSFSAVAAGMAVLFTPLIWPLVGLGMLGWALVMRGVEHGADNRST